MSNQTLFNTAGALALVVNYDIYGSGYNDKFLTKQAAQTIRIEAEFFVRVGNAILIIDTDTDLTESDLDTGSFAISTTYYLYACQSLDGSTTPVFKISLNSTYPSGGWDATNSRQIGGFDTDGSGNVSESTLWDLRTVDVTTTGVENGDIPGGEITWGKLDTTSMAAASPTFTNVICSALTNDAVPYKTAAGFVDSPITTDGSDVSIAGNVGVEGGNLNVGSPAGSAHPLNIASSGGSNLRLIGRDNGSTDEATILFQHYDGSIAHGRIQGLSSRLDFYGGTTHTMTLQSGNIAIGTTSLPASLAKGFAIGNGTAPTAGQSGVAGLFTLAGELKAFDESNNQTTISPHTFALFEPDPGYDYPWSFYAENPYIGKKINVDMYGAIKAIETLWNETHPTDPKQFIYTADISVADWDADQQQRFNEQQTKIESLTAQADEINAALTLARGLHPKLEAHFQAQRDAIEIPAPHVIATMPQWIAQCAR